MHATVIVVPCFNEAARLGADIDRRRARHDLGRVFASAASLVLDLPVYDTQCGAKFFADTPALRAALATPFASRWAFDVELVGRLLAGAPGVPGLPRGDFLEVTTRPRVAPRPPARRSNPEVQPPVSTRCN